MTRNVSELFLVAGKLIATVRKRTERGLQIVEDAKAISRKKRVAPVASNDP